jgi:O-antigen/teichoic acid export membrane protein
VCRQLDSLTWRTTLSVALTLGALTFLPFAVTVIAGPVQGAAFALCLAITQSLDFVGSSLGVSLVVQASARADQAAQMARQVWRRAALIVGAGAVVLTVAAPVLMRAMNPAYLRLHSTEVIAVMCASSLTRTVFVTWSALQRARRALRPVLSLNFLGALTLYSILPSLAHHYGALGAAVALATAQTVLSTGAVAHILFARRRQRFVARTGALHRPTVPLLAPAVEGRD